MILAHKIRLDPTGKQEQYFRRACGTTRHAYNWGLDEWNKQYAAGLKPSGMALKKEFNAIRGATFPWTRDVHRDCTSQPFANLQKAFSNFFKKKAQYPEKKKKGRCKDSFYVACDKLTVHPRSVRLPVIGSIRTRESLRFSGKILAASVSRTADGWYISIQVDVADLRRNRVAGDVVGVDLGITTFATLSTGEKIGGPKPLSDLLYLLQTRSKQHSRKKKGSKNKRKSAQKLAKLHARIVNVRTDFLHKLTSRLCCENQAIGIEDLNVKGMVRNRHLSRALSDASFGEFRRQLQYKSLIYETEIMVADRWYPSSKTCSDCGFKVETLPLSTRQWACTCCGTVHDRDINAARNLEKLPRASREVTPTEMEALVRPKRRAKLPSKK